MSAWEKLSKDTKRLAKYIQPGLDWAYKYYSRMDCSSAYVITMCMYFCLPAPDYYAYWHL